ncbi:MAG TPA: hypothetical protein VFV03_02645 [Solirubrobacteraceae bacterium]|nr:hypothetical protein [Solirubrobacteraceae bacterium]
MARAPRLFDLRQVDVRELVDSQQTDEQGDPDMSPHQPATGVRGSEVYAVDGRSGSSGCKDRPEDNHATARRLASYCRGR